MLGGNNDWVYIVDKNYAKNPEHYTRAYLMIQEDLIKLFEYIEPASQNKKTYSFRIHQLFMRTCIELEANFKAILSENYYTPIDKNGKKRNKDKWNIKDFQLINKTHFLDCYSVKAPIWNGEDNIFQPFKNWNDNKPLPWYQAYNQSKHNRLTKFELANFNNLMNAITALLIILTAQFKTESFSPGSTGLTVKTASYYEGDFGLGEYFIVNFPENWNDVDCYEFNWNDLKNSGTLFEKINYNTVKNFR